LTKEKLISQLEESHLKFSCSPLGHDMRHNCKPSMGRAELVAELSKMNEPLSDKVRGIRKEES